MVTLTALGIKQLIFTKVAAAWALFTKAIYAAKVAMVLFNTTNPIGWIALVITAIGTLGVVIYKFRKQILGFFKSVRDMLNKYVIMVFNSLPKFIRELLIGKNKRPAGDDFLITLPKVKLEDDDKNNVLDGSTNLEGANKDTATKQSQVLQGMKQGLDDYKAKVEDVAGSIKNAMGNALQGMEDALVNFVTTGKLAFGDLARSIINDMIRIMIQQAIMKPFTGWLSGIFGSADGNVIAGGEVKKYKSGGIVSRPTYFPMKNGMGLMGEAGAEAIMPLKRGRNGKLGVQASGGTGNIVVNVNASGSSVEGDEAQGKQLGKLIGIAVQTELIRQKRPGGILG